MLLTATSGVRGTVYDLETGRRVPKVFELNEERGYLKAWFVVRQDDERPEREQIRKDAAGNHEWYEAHGRFRFVEAERSRNELAMAGATSSQPSLLGAERCARCSSPLTLPGDELCPRCRAQERGQRNRFLVERITTPLFDRKCEECSRVAVWSVADEVGVSPEQHGRKLWDRGMTVGRRYYCDRHYQPARILDAKGEVMGEGAYAGPDLAAANP